mmetsp:Transcript_26069/g.54858  ORF Transcript_26069/g.54858 Transcript_26069/m.54858 type:complete len:332 (+) Transcript_26069:655-1650(+)
MFAVAVAVAVFVTDGTFALRFGGGNSGIVASDNKGTNRLFGIRIVVVVVFLEKFSMEFHGVHDHLVFERLDDSSDARRWRCKSNPGFVGFAAVASTGRRQRWRRRRVLRNLPVVLEHLCRSSYYRRRRTPWFVFVMLDAVRRNNTFDRTLVVVVVAVAGRRRGLLPIARIGLFETILAIVALELFLFLVVVCRCSSSHRPRMRWFSTTGSTSTATAGRCIPVAGFDPDRVWFAFVCTYHRAAHEIGPSCTTRIVLLEFLRHFSDRRRPRWWHFLVSIGGMIRGMERVWVTIVVVVVVVVVVLVAGATTSARFEFRFSRGCYRSSSGGWWWR